MNTQSKKKSFFRSLNIFTILAVIAGVALIFRVANIGKNDQNTTAPIIAAASAVEEKAAPAENVLTSSKTEEKNNKSAPTEASGEQTPSEQKPSEQPPLDEPRAFSSAEIEVLQSLSKRRDALDQRERQLAEREAVIKAAEQEVDKKITELKSMQSGLKDLLGQQEKMEEERIVSLVRIYEGMKPKEAATIFNTLDMDILITVIGRMSERKSAPILASMDPEKARTVTTRLALQRRLPELEDAQKTTEKTSP